MGSTPRATRVSGKSRQHEQHEQHGGELARFRRSDLPEHDLRHAAQHLELVRDPTLAGGDGLGPDERETGEDDGDDGAGRADDLRGVDDPVGELVRAADHRQRRSLLEQHAQQPARPR
jgi:hypothetical protein